MVVNKMFGKKISFLCIFLLLCSLQPQVYAFSPYKDKQKLPSYSDQIHLTDIRVLGSAKKTNGKALPLGPIVSQDRVIWSPDGIQIYLAELDSQREWKLA